MDVAAGETLEDVLTREAVWVDEARLPQLSDSQLDLSTTARSVHISFAVVDFASFLPQPGNRPARCRPFHEGRGSMRRKRATVLGDDPEECPAGIDGSDGRRCLCCEMNRDSGEYELDHDVDEDFEDEGMTTVEYAVGTVVAAAFAAVLYRIVTGDSIVSGLTDLVNSALQTAF